MTTAIGGIVVDIDARLTRLESSLDKANRRLGRFGSDVNRHGRGIQGSLDRINAGFGRVATAAAALGGIAAVAGAARLAEQFGQLAARSIELAANMGETSQQIGVTVEQLQVLRQIAVQNNVTTETMQRSIARLTRTLGEAKAGVVTAQRAFHGLGFTPEDLSRFSQGGDALREVAERIMRIPDPARQAAAANQLMGRSGQQLLPVLSAVATGYDAAHAEAVRFGLVTEEQARKADALADRLALLQERLSVGLASAFSDNLGPMNSFAENLERIPGLIRGVIAFADLLGSALGRLAGPLQILRAAREEGFNPRRIAQNVNAQNNDIGHQIARAAEELLRPNEPTAGDIDFDISTGGGGRGARSGRDDAERRREEALRRAHDIESDLRRADLEILRERERQLHDVVEQTALRTEILDLEHRQADADLDLAVALGDRTAVEADQLKERRAQLRVLEQQTLNLDQDHEIAGNRIELELDGLAMRRELLEGESDLLRTAAARRQAELKILEIAEQEARMRLERIRDDERLSHEEREAARRRLDTLSAEYGNRREGVMRQTQGPLESYFDRLPRTAAEMNEALEGVAANGLQAIEDGLVDILTGTESVGEAFRKMALSIIADLLRIQVQKMMLGLLGSIAGGLGGIGGGAGGGDLLGAASKIAPGAFAKGGRPPVGRLSMVGEEGPELFVPDTHGTIIPNHRLMGAGPAPERGRGGDPLEGAMAGANFNFHFPRGTSAREARQTGRQAASAFLETIGDARRTGVA